MTPSRLDLLIPSSAELAPKRHEISKIGNDGEFEMILSVFVQVYRNNTGVEVKVYLLDSYSE